MHSRSSVPDSWTVNSRRTSQTAEQNAGTWLTLQIGVPRSGRIITHRWALLCFRGYKAETKINCWSQDRVTDHRLGLSFMNLTAVMQEDGLHEFIAAIQKDHDATLMEEMIHDHLA